MDFGTWVIIFVVGAVVVGVIEAINTSNKYASQLEVKEQAKQRGYHIVQHGDQWLIFCDTAAVRIIA